MNGRPGKQTTTRCIYSIFVSTLQEIVRENNQDINKEKERNARREGKDKKDVRQQRE